MRLTLVSDVSIAIGIIVILLLDVATQSAITDIDRLAVGTLAIAIADGLRP